MKKLQAHPSSSIASSSSDASIVPQTALHSLEVAVGSSLSSADAAAYVVPPVLPATALQSAYPVPSAVPATALQSLELAVERNDSYPPAASSAASPTILGSVELAQTDPAHPGKQQLLLLLEISPSSTPASGGFR